MVASGNVVVNQNDMTLYGRMAQFDQDRQWVHLFGPVTLRQGEMVLTSKEIKAYSQENRVDAMGNVQFRFGDIHGTADKTSYERMRQRVQLEGRPKAWQGTDEISGQSISIDLKRGKIITKGDAKVILNLDKIKK